MAIAARPRRSPAGSGSPLGEPLYSLQNTFEERVPETPSQTAPKARQFLLVAGIIYLVLWLYGLIVAQDSAANFVPLNAADNWLHLFLGAGLVALSFLYRNAGGMHRNPVTRD